MYHFLVKMDRLLDLDTLGQSVRQIKKNVDAAVPCTFS